MSDCSSGRPVSERMPPGLANHHHKHSAAVCPGRGRAATRPADPSHSLEGTRLSVVARTSGGCNLQFTRCTQSHTHKFTDPPRNRLWAHVALSNSGIKSWSCSMFVVNRISSGCCAWHRCRCWLLILSLLLLWLVEDKSNRAPEVQQTF